MHSAQVPIIFALAALLWISAGAVLPDPPAAPATLLLAPILYLAGGRIRAQMAGLSPRDAMAPAAQVLLGTFLIGGVLQVLDPEAGSPTGGSGLAASLLLGLALSLGEPALAPGGAAPDGPRDRPAGIRRLLAGEALLTLALGAVLAPVIARFLAPLPEGSGAGGQLPPAVLDLAKGFAAGAGVGLAGGAGLLLVRGELPRSALHVGLAEATVVASAALGSGAASLAALTAGFLSGAGAERSGAAGRGAARDGTSSCASLAAVVAGAGIFIFAASRLDLARFGSAAGAGAALWLGSVVLRFLVHFGFGGLLRPGRSGRWLPALAWGLHPGPAGLGLFLAAGAGTGGAAFLPPREAELLVAVLIALLVQGVTAGAAIAAAERGLAETTGRERWMRLIARGIALRAERRAVLDLRSRGWLEDSAAAAMEEAIGAAERQVEMEEEEMRAAEPGLPAEELTRAVERILDAGRRAVEEARESGRVDGDAAREVERELARSRVRSASAPLSELLGGAPRGGPEGAVPPAPREE